jgi:hypothetical protein
MAAAELLIMPSYLESLSMVALEAWAMRKPVLANAKCDVLQGQCIRSNAGLFYGSFPEFAETMRAIDTTPSLQSALGRNGRAFFERNYAWPVIEKKYVDMLQQLATESAPQRMEPVPGWFARRSRSQPPADSIVKQLPAGPYREARPSAVPSTSLRAGSPQPSGVRRQPPTETRPPVQAQRAPSEPRRDERPDQRDGRRDQRGPRPDNRRPSDRPQQRPANRPQPPPAAGAEASRPKAEGSSEQSRRDQRRGRPHRRGRRPGGGGGTR